MPFLWVKEAGRIVKSVPIAAEMRIGRGADCELVLHDRRASRVHSVIRATGGVMEIEDQGSTNGTFLNGDRITGKVALKIGDTIAIGETNLLVRQESYFEPEGPRVEETPTGEVRTLRVDGAEAVIAAPKDREKAYERLVSLYRLASAGASARTVGALFQLIVEAAEEVLESDRVFLMLVEKDELRPWRRGTGKRGALAANLERVPISKSIVKTAAEEQRPVVMAERRGEKFRRRQSVLDIGISTALAVPLAVGKDVLAVLYADRLGDTPEFTDEDAQWMVAVGQIASGTLYALRNQEALSSRVRSLENMLSGEIEMVGESTEMKELKALIEQAAKADSPVLITGESGVGKELVARLLHFGSPRAGKALEVLNCAALPETLAESELFGHVKGAFTGAVEEAPGRFALADGGSLFLDEIGELPPALQAKLLRAIETGEVRMVGGTETRMVDVRIIAATNRDIEKQVKEGLFREDLFYRLNVIRIHVPPLRQRRDDIVPLVKHYLGQFARAMGRVVPELASDALLLLTDYPWPGNVRELRNAIERLMVLNPRDRLTADDVRAVLRGGPPAAPAAAITLAEMERRHILNVVEACAGNKTKAAEILGINRSTLYQKLQELGFKE